MLRQIFSYRDRDDQGKRLDVETEVDLGRGISCHDRVFMLLQRLAKTIGFHVATKYFVSR